MVSPGGQKVLRDGRAEKIQCCQCVANFTRKLSIEVVGALIPEDNLTIIPNLWRERN
jgi:hypothetical protein